MELLMENEQEKVNLQPSLLEQIEAVITLTLKTEGVTEDLEISLLIVDDEAIKALNHEHRHKNAATDVLSFPMHEQKDTIKPGDLLGDIVISAERAKEQAQEYGHSFEREVCFLVVHSMLHLLGYDHERGDADTKVMRDKEESILTEFGLTRGTL